MMRVNTDGAAPRFRRWKCVDGVVLVLMESLRSSMVCKGSYVSISIDGTAPRYRRWKCVDGAVLVLMEPLHGS